jgi:SAM-dependent methyltransferase
MGDHKEFWEQRWAANRLQDLLNTHRDGRLGEFDEIFTRYLPKDLPILEAGCGLGQLVMALHSRGYHVEGVDYAAQTVARVKNVAPELNIRVGDVYNLDVPDGTYGGYISIGIFEHNPDGPIEGLREARRVLHQNGRALIAVPYLNAQRRKWLRAVPETERSTLDNGLSFYQFYYSSEEFSHLLRQSGLDVIEIYPYGVYAGLTRDFVLGRWLHARSFFAWRIHRRVTRLCSQAPLWARWRWAHMLMFVCRRSS